MRILQIAQRPQRRGAEVFAYQLSAELRRQGHTVATAYLYPYHGSGALPLEEGDRLLGGDEHHPLETLIGFRPALLRKLKETIEDFRPDITQVNGARSVKYGAAVRWLHWGGAGALVYRNIGASGDWIRGVRRKLFYHLVIRRIDGVIAISSGSLQALRSALPRGTPYEVIPNAVDPRALRPAVSRNALRLAADTPLDATVAVFVGSLGPEKRVDRLIEAVRSARRSVPNLRLWIIGDGPLRVELERLVDRDRLKEVVRFFGVQDDVASWLAAADLLALSSDTEGVPGVVLEAGFLGLPVVATRVGGVPECVLDEETGLLVDVGDFASLVAALTRLAHDEGLRATLGRRAHEWVTASHTIEKVAARYVDFYDRVRSHPRGGAAATESHLGSSRAQGRAEAIAARD